MRCAQDLLEKTQRALRWRAVVRWLADGLLVASCAAVAFLPLLWISSSFPLWGAFIVLPMVGGLLWRASSLRLSQADAGLYLDEKLESHERFLSLTALPADVTHPFRDALLRDVDTLAESVRLVDLLPGWLPQRASYVGLPIAALTAGLLLGNPLAHSPAGPSPRTGSTSQVASAPTTSTGMPDAGPEQALREQLRVLTGGPAAPPDAATIEAIRRLTEELEATTGSDPAADALAGDESNDDTGVGEGAGEGEMASSGPRAEWLTLRARVRQLLEPPPSSSSHTDLQSPDWAAYRELNASLSPPHAHAVRAYFRELTSGSHESPRPRRRR